MIPGVSRRRFAPVAIGLALAASTLLFSSVNSYAAEGAAPPVPRFSSNVTGGTGPVTVTFDPSRSYLPPSTAAQTYYYQATWDFGDTTIVQVPPGGPTTDPNVVLAKIDHVYFNEFVYTVTLTLNVYVRDPAASPAAYNLAASNFTTGMIRLANTNFPPVPQLQNIGSEPDGTLPFTLTVDPSASIDEDGFLVWAAIDWGDGAADLISAPPSFPAKLASHTYTAPGIYKVTLSVIDNGRLPLDYPVFAPPVSLPQYTNAADPQGAQQFYADFQSGLYADSAKRSSVFPQLLDLRINAGAPYRLDSEFNPHLKQESLFVQIPGNIVATKGQFKLDFRDVSRSSIDLTIQLNDPVNSLAGAAVQMTLGSGSASLALPAFQTDAKGRYKDAGRKLSFVFDRKKQQFRIKLADPALMAAMQQSIATVVNGNVDLPVVLTVNNAVPGLYTVVRFAYNAKAEKGGTGKLGISYPRGN